MLAALLTLGVLAGAARAAGPATEAAGPRVRVELISERAGVEPGSPLISMMSPFPFSNFAA